MDKPDLPKEKDHFVLDFRFVRDAEVYSFPIDDDHIVVITTDQNGRKPAFYRRVEEVEGPVSLYGAGKFLHERRSSEETSIPPPD